MFVLDTNILSELMDPTASNAIVTWADSVAKRDLFTTALTQAEILYGLAIMPKGRRRNLLIEWADAMFRDDFRGRILPFDEQAAIHYADIAATRRFMGRRIEVVDAQIAAIARAHNMAVVTRDVKGFVDCGLEVVTP